MRRLSPILVLFCSTAPAQTWTQLPDFPGIARDDASSFSVGNDVYVGTGMDVGFSLTSDWYKYSVDANSWTSIAPLPAGGRQYCASFSIDGTGYLFGGTDGNLLNELWAYDPQVDQWTTRAPLPSAGRSGSVAFVLDGKGFIATGKMAPTFTPTSELWMYDPTADQWSQRSDLPATARALASAFTVGDSAYLFTGQDDQGVPLADGVWKYVASSDSWTWVAPFLGAGPLFGADGFGLYDRGVVVCGAFTSPPYEVATDIFLPSTSQWMGAPPVFIGPGRKGGSGAVIGTTICYGTGTTGVERLKDWYKLEWPVGLEENEPPGSFTLLGVPADRQLLIALNEQRADGELFISTVEGKILLRSGVSGSKFSIATDLLADGAYVISLQDGRGRSSQRFVVLH